MVAGIRCDAQRGEPNLIGHLNRIVLPLLAAALAAGPAAAHHVMDGELPATFGQGLLSGLGHPVIGIDHLAFLVAVGVAVGIGRLPLLTSATFVAASALGVALHVQGVPLPGAELAVAASVIVVGALLWRGVALSAGAWMGLFGLAGLFHGYAYGESIFGAGVTPLLAYLLGLVIVQSALATGIAVLVRRHATLGGRFATRLAGGAVAAVGLFAMAQQAFAG